MTLSLCGVGAILGICEWTELVSEGRSRASSHSHVSSHLHTRTQGNTVTERSPGVVTPHLGSGSTSPPGKTHLDLISGNLCAEGGRGGVTVVLMLDLI